MDYSACGYHASEIAIPDVRNAVFVGSDGADCYEKLQRAINYVSALKPDKTATAEPYCWAKALSE